MWLFGSRKAAFKARISELEDQLAAANETIRELEAVSLHALEENANGLLRALEQAAISSQTIREAIATLHQNKGVLREVRDRCSNYTQRLNAVDQELPALTAVFREWDRLILAVKQKLGVPDTHSSAAFAAIASIDSLADDMLAEGYKDLLEAAQVKSIKRDVAERQRMKEKLAELERRDRAHRIRNPKAAKAALPMPAAIPGGRRSHGGAIVADRAERD